MRPKLVAIKVSGGHLIPVIMRASSRGRGRRDFEASIISRARQHQRGPVTSDAGVVGRASRQVDRLRVGELYGWPLDGR